MYRLIYLVVFWSICSCRPAAFSGVDRNVKIQKSPVQKITLKEDGKDRFIQLEKKPLTVVAFLSPECPLCKNYSSVLNVIKEKYRDNIQVYGIVPGKTYTADEIADYVRDYKIGFPVWIDVKKTLTMTLNATVTPEVVLLNTSGETLYQGAIDDWVMGLGQKKERPEKFYLTDAISKALSGEEISLKKTSSVGCLINEF